MTRGQIKTRIRVNLADLGVTFYTDDDLNDSIQDAYDDIAALTQCITKNKTLNWQNNLTYYNFANLGVFDYMGTTAIFNNVSNLWLRDDLSLKDFDRLRADWEIWAGQPQFWAPSDPINTAITPRIHGTTVAAGGAFSLAFSPGFYIAGSGTSPYGTFKLVYWATAPSLTSDSDTFLIATDMQVLVEKYVTGDLLEQAQEYAKAAVWFENYYEDIGQYAERVKVINKKDLLLRV